MKFILTDYGIWDLIAIIEIKIKTSERRKKIKLQTPISNNNKKSSEEETLKNEAWEIVIKMKSYEGHNLSIREYLVFHKNP